ncbi:MAG: hypothetical protein NXI00_19115 [Cytophagales bacterium]|nr:hypothetical protein [Cytophagales bacterium]
MKTKSLTIRLDSEVHQFLTERSELEEVTLTSLVKEALAAYKSTIERQAAISNEQYDGPKKPSFMSFLLGIILMTLVVTILNFRR